MLRSISQLRRAPGLLSARRSLGSCVSSVEGRSRRVGRKDSYLSSSSTFSVARRNYVVIFHAPESDKRKLTPEEEELQMELADVEYEESEQVFLEEENRKDKFEDMRFDFSTISYENYIPGGNDIRDFLREDDEYVDGTGIQYLSREEQQEMDGAAASHGCDPYDGYRKVKRKLFSV